MGRVLYLVFNEGYAATAGDVLVRRELCAEATRLAKLVCVLMPDEPEALGLLALLLLQERDVTRGSARTASSCSSLTRTGRSGTARRSTRACASSIARSPCDAPVRTSSRPSSGRARRGRAPEVIVAAYAALERLDPSPIVRLNRAVAVALAGDVEEGLALIDGIDGSRATATWRRHAPTSFGVWPPR